MKTLKRTTILFAAILAMGSCKDLLDPAPTDRVLQDAFWKTERDATFALNGLYSTVVETASHYVSWDGMTDIGFTHLPQSPESFILQGQFDALNSRVYTDYTSLYAGIRTANTFLEKVKGITFTTAGLSDRYQGEARTLRAYFYGRLAFLYGDVPLVTTDISESDSKALTRTPVAQVWDFVSTELGQAADQLPTTQKDIGRVTKGTALGLKARYMLYAGRYQDAANAANAVIASNVFDLFPTYKSLFTTPAENNKEVMFDIQFIKGSLANDIFLTLAQRSQSSNSLYVPTKVYVDAFQMTNGKNITDAGSGFDPINPYKNRDPRLTYSIFVPGDIMPNGAVFNPKPGSKTTDDVGASFTVSPTGFNVKKYVNAEDLKTPANTGINLILLRYAEVLLTYAEAMTELNTIDASVYNAVNKIRQRSDVLMPVIAPGRTQAEMRAIIRQERVVELGFEGQRYFDIRRWKIAETVMPGKVFGMTYVDAANKLQTVEVTGWTNFWNNRNYLWPIPQIERDINRGMSQNAGY